MRIERPIEGFVAKYPPGIAADLRAACVRLRARFPRGFELIFDNDNALVFGFSPIDQSNGSFISSVRLASPATSARKRGGG